MDCICLVSLCSFCMTCNIKEGGGIRTRVTYVRPLRTAPPWYGLYFLPEPMMMAIIIPSPINNPPILSISIAVCCNPNIISCMNGSISNILTPPLVIFSSYYKWGGGGVAPVSGALTYVSARFPYRGPLSKMSIIRATHSYSQNF